MVFLAFYGEGRGAERAFHSANHKDGELSLGTACALKKLQKLSCSPPKVQRVDEKTQCKTRAKEMLIEERVRKNE